ncbi:SPOR domain-containing protein [Desulfocurvus vexinensis]|uniref:SPOR domain-containing protein n=1 Tax=Desulfocurvus vexinensis TaxID=399548 RepID=UPI0004AF7F08|nr:SPOR domain-containing protein [Desulfocurvus vexinensis]
MAKDNTRRKTRDDGDGQPRRLPFNLTAGGLVTTVVVSVAALAWAFVLGVLVGRGYKPEEAVPELARIMPRPEANATAPAPAPAPPEVLRAEELEFYDDLHRKPGEAAPVKPRAAAAPGAQPPAAAPQAPAPAAATAPAAAPAAQASGQRFAYVYQVGALRDAEVARKFAARLQGQGLTTSVESAQAQGTTWHRILVHFQGTPEQTEALKAKLAAAGVQKPIIRTKTPL